MRILLDECLDPGIRDFLSEHQITTVGEAKWQSTADNQLIQVPKETSTSFSHLTGGFEFQHNLKKLTFGIVIVHPPAMAAKTTSR